MADFAQIPSDRSIVGHPKPYYTRLTIETKFGFKNNEKQENFGFS